MMLALRRVAKLQQKSRAWPTPARRAASLEGTLQPSTLKRSAAPQQHSTQHNTSSLHLPLPFLLLLLRRCVQAKARALEELQGSLAAKKEAIERVAAASARLEAAELQHEDAADALDQTEASLAYIYCCRGNSFSCAVVQYMDVWDVF